MSSGRVTPTPADGKASALSAAKSQKSSGSKTPALDKSTPVKEEVVVAQVVEAVPVVVNPKKV
jgi:hypothetical protein